MFKRIFALTLAAVMTLALAACGKEEPEVIPEPVVITTTPTPKPKTKVTYCYIDENETEWLKACEEAYEKKNDDIDIEIKLTDPANLSERAAGDAFEIESMEMGDAIEGGLLEAVDSYMSKGGIRRDEYYENVLNMFLEGSSLYAIPESYDTVGLWYNKSLFDAKGVSYPNGDFAWMNLVDTVGSMTDEAGGVYGLAVDYKSLIPVLVTINEIGGYIYDEDGNMTGFDSNLTRAGIQCWVDLMDAGYIPSVANMNETDAIQKLMNNEAAIVYGLASDYQKLKGSDNLSNFNCTYIPTLGGNRITPVFGRGIAISASSGVKKEAADWISFIMKDTAALDGFMEVCHGVPASMKLEDKYSAIGGEELNLFIFAEEMRENSYNLPVVADFAAKQEMIADKLSNVFELKNSVDEACIEICGQIN